MAAEGGAGIVVHVVADETDFLLQPQRPDRLEQNGVARLVVAQDIQQAQALGRAILQVAHVNVAARRR